MAFTSDGECLVTCGDRHVNFWSMPEGVSGGGGFIAIGGDTRQSDGAVSDASARVTAEEEVGRAGKRSEEKGVTSHVSAKLEGWPATIGDKLKGLVFVDVASSANDGQGGGLDSVFCVTQNGILCSFTR